MTDTQTTTNAGIRIAENVHIYTYVFRDHQWVYVYHLPCYVIMTRRNHAEGPRYWCDRCGYVLPDGLAMAIRLYEVNI